jgi:polar amino acid transport system substrate-binding protein
MKNFILYLLILSSVTYADKINRPIIITTQNWKPYNYESTNSNIEGIATEILIKTLNNMSVEYSIKIYPWARAQYLVEIGEADAFYSASINEKRNSYAVPSDSLLPQIWYWYLLQDSKLNPSDTKFKKDAKVGALLGSNMLNYIKSNNFNVDAQPTSTKSLTNMLLKKRLDAILVNDLVMKEYFHKQNISEVKFKKFLSKNKPLKVYFSKEFIRENPWFLDKFNETLKKYQKNQ